MNTGDVSPTPCNEKISEIIYNNIKDFFFEMTGKKFVLEDYSFIHNTIVLSNDIGNISEYFCNLIGTIELPSPLENISTTKNYHYYPQDGASVITDYNPEEFDVPLYNAIILESIKLNIYLRQIVNMEITQDMNTVIRNDLYLESLFFAPRVPIETHNLLSYIYNTKSFRHHKEAVKLKISYMSAENESKKNRNSVFLNILLYIISLIGAIGTLDTLETQLGIPFQYSFCVVVSLFLLFGVRWGIVEWKRSKRF